MKNSLIALAFFCSAAHTADNVSVAEHSAWVRATPPGSSTTAIYLTLSNSGSADIKLMAAASDISERIELHTHKHVDGLMKMQQVESIVVPPNDKAELAPHGDHIMVFNLDSALKPGETVELTLKFDNGSEQVIEVPVRKEGPSDKNMQHTGTKKTAEDTQHKNH